METINIHIPGEVLKYTKDSDNVLNFLVTPNSIEVLFKDGAMRTFVGFPYVIEYIRDETLPQEDVDKEIKHLKENPEVYEQTN